MLELNKTYALISGKLVTIIEHDEDDLNLPWLGDNNVWYSSDGIALLNPLDNIVPVEVSKYDDLNKRLAAVEAYIKRQNEIEEEGQKFIEVITKVFAEL